MTSIIDHLNAGGCIRVNLTTKQVTLVHDSEEIKNIPCTYGDVQDLIDNRLVKMSTDTAEMVLTRSDASITLTQRDREVFKALIESWEENGNDLPGKMSYQDVFDLCDKFSVVRPPRILKFLRNVKN